MPPGRVGRPPTNKRELFDAVLRVIDEGWHTIPDRKPFGGPGAPGLYFEHLLGFDVNNRDTPDALGWELKWHTDRTALVTLLHKSPDNAPEVGEDLAEVSHRAGAALVRPIAARRSRCEAAPADPGEG